MREDILSKGYWQPIKSINFDIRNKDNKIVNNGKCLLRNIHVLQIKVSSCYHIRVISTWLSHVSLAECDKCFSCF